MSSTANRVIKNTGYLYAKMGITMFISLYTTRLILNSLGASDFGIFNIVGGAIAMLGFLNAAMAGATQRFMSYCEGEGDKEKQKSIFNISLVLHFFIALLLGIVLWIAGYFFFNGILNIPADRIFAAKVIYGSLIVSTLFTVMTVPYDAVMNAHENMKYYAVVGIIESILKLAVAFAVVYTSSDKLIVYGLLMACIPLITMAIMRVYCHKHYVECVFAPKQYWHKGLMREMTGFAGWNFFSSTIIMVSAQGQGIILNHFFGTLLNAAQGIANQLNGQLQVLSSTMLKVLNPILGKSVGACNKKLLIDSTLLGAKYSTALYMLVAIPFFIEAPYILKLWLKEVPEWTIVFVRFQLLKTFVEFQFGTLPQAISATGRIKKYALWSGTFNALQLPAIYILFKLGYPPYFQYIATIIWGNLFVYGVALILSKKLFNLSIVDYIKNVTLPLYGTLVLVITVLYIYNAVLRIDSMLDLFAFLLFAIFLCTVVFLAIGSTKIERQMIIALKDSIINKLYRKK